MAYTAHPACRSAFERRVQHLGVRHGRIPLRSPWRNGLIGRSHRTDNEACFQRERFTCSKQRRYHHRLWEMHYNPSLLQLLQSE